MKKLFAVFALVTMAMGSVAIPASAAYYQFAPPAQNSGD